MADRTAIEWADATWNIVTGCSVVSPGCANCYAMRQGTLRRLQRWCNYARRSGCTWEEYDAGARSSRTDRESLSLLELANG